MFTFSKVISLGIVLAGGSGLSAYLIPYYLSGSKNSVNETLFKSSNYSSENWANFSKEEKEILEQLKILFSELSKTLKKSIELRDLINQSMQDFMQSITSTDSFLSSLYQKNKELIENIEKLLGEAKQQSNRKMEIEANLRRNEYSQNLMRKIGESINSLYGNLEPIVKLIEEKDKENQTSSTTSSVGGGTSASAQAKKTLEEVNENFQKVQASLTSLLLEKIKKEGELFKEEASLTFYFVNLRTSIAFLNLSVASLQEKSLEKQKEINKKIEELNQLREKLKQANQDWEEIKKKIVSFQNYGGILKNAICKNSEHKYISDSREETVNCEDFSKNSFQK